MVLSVSGAEMDGGAPGLIAIPPPEPFFFFFYPQPPGTLDNLCLIKLPLLVGLLPSPPPSRLKPIFCSIREHQTPHIHPVPPPRSPPHMCSSTEPSFTNLSTENPKKTNQFFAQEQVNKTSHQKFVICASSNWSAKDNMSTDPQL